LASPHKSNKPRARSVVSGGEIVALGTPEEIVKAARFYTGQFLKPVLAREAPGRRKKKGMEAAE
jgi:excinuclease ABC subunit A